MIDLNRPRTVMEPAEVLHELIRLGIRFKVKSGTFLTDYSMHLDPTSKNDSAGLRYAIEEHADALAELAPTWTPTQCHWCHRPIPNGARFVRVYSADDGTRRSFHADCYTARVEKLPHLPQPEVFIDEPGYTVVMEDSGVCCYCQIGEATMPEEGPNVCNRCWRLRQTQAAGKAAA